MGARILALDCVAEVTFVVVSQFRNQLLYELQNGVRLGNNEYEKGYSNAE